MYPLGGCGIDDDDCVLPKAITKIRARIKWLRAITPELGSTTLATLHIAQTNELEWVLGLLGVKDGD
jgi:hypothetical protein